MLFINTLENKKHSCDFYFGLEEYLIKDFNHQDDIFLLWTVDKTVMIGRHQITELEINNEYVKDNNISIVRRNSGGGAVYTDPNCFQYSFITSKNSHSDIFDSHVSKIIDALNKIGVKAYFSGRNDILVDGKKISGNAEYIYKDKMVIHGTILYDTNFEELLGSLNPSKAKLSSHAITSVKSRVSNIKDMTELSKDELYDYLVNYVKTSEMNYKELDLKKIQKYSEKFISDKWNFGKNPKYTLKEQVKYAAGNFTFQFEIKNNIVKSLRINGDYFSLKDISLFEQAFENVEFSRDEFRKVLKKHKISDYIYKLKNIEFLDTFFQRKRISKPDYLKMDLRDLNKETKKIRNLLRQHNLHTVCQEASCPNQLECFSNKTATFMILGDKCTRNCKFCDVSHDIPTEVDPNEPQNIVKAIDVMGLEHVVITSVTRDDLPDYGSHQFVKCINAIRKAKPKVTIEVLIPDFLGDEIALKNVVDAKPDVINHNMETIKRLYDGFRDNADYERSLKLLKTVKQMDSSILTKSGIMVGIGETKNEVFELFDDLRDVNCDILTIGQYLRPSKTHIEVKEYITLELFEEYKTEALSKGFQFVSSGPLVRSSYKAINQFKGDNNEKN